MILYEKHKQKGFRGYKYIAKAYIDEQGNDITKDTKEGTEMIEIVSEIISMDKEEDVLERLKQNIINKIKEYKPIWKG
jgi:myosin-crossreactive antigen